MSLPFARTVEGSKILIVNLHFFRVVGRDNSRNTFRIVEACKLSLYSKSMQVRRFPTFDVVSRAYRSQFFLPIRFKLGI